LNKEIGYREKIHTAKKSNTSAQYIGSNDLRTMFESWLAQNDYSDNYIHKIDFHSIKNKLRDLGIQCVKKQISYNTRNWYVFDTTKFKSQLLEKYDGSKFSVLDTTELN
jgi:hypothetical protein